MTCIRSRLGYGFAPCSFPEPLWGVYRGKKKEEEEYGNGEERGIDVGP